MTGVERRWAAGSGTKIAAEIAAVGAAAQALLGHRAEALPADVYVSKTDAAMRRAAEVMEAAMGR